MEKQLATAPAHRMSPPHRRRLQLIVVRHGVTVAGTLNGKVEEGGGVWLVRQREVPELEVIVVKPPALHQLQQQHAVVVCQSADVGVCVRCLVKAVEPSAHINAAEAR